MKITTKLLVGFLSISSIILIAGILGVIEINHLWDKSKTASVKNAPLADAAMEIKLSATTAHLWFEEIITGAETKDNLILVWELLDESLWYVDAMLEGGQNTEGHFHKLEDEIIRTKLFSVKKRLIEFKRIAVVRFDNQFGKKELVDQTLDDQFDAIFKKFIIEADEVEGILHLRIAKDIELMEKTALTAIFMLSAATILGFIFALVATYYLSREIIKQVGGEPAEIAYITQQVADGNLDYQFDNSKNTTGIYAAVQMMVQNLKNINTEQKIQNWLKTGQSRLNEQIRGEQDITILTDNVISFLTTYVEAQVGLLYILKTLEEKQTSLQMIASYAYVNDGQRPTQFPLGTGLVGHAAAKQKTIVIAQRADECPPIIRSGLANAQPRNLLLIPFFYEEQLKGIIEIGFSGEITELQQNFLEQIMPHIGIAVNTAESRTKMKILLEQSQTQAKELKAQQTKLQSKQSELLQSNEELQSQSEELQSQSEELQTQQEELRQTNDELEEKTKDLEQQKLTIEEKNSSLEQNKAEIEKSKALIETKMQELNLASKYKSEFLANMSHELRTPLNSILILAELLKENKNDSLDEKQVQYAQTIHSAGVDLLTLINEILDLSKVEAGKIEVQIMEFTLKDLMKSVEMKFSPIAENKKIAFNTIIADDIPDILKTDEQRLQQIITNLLSNAMKFTKKGKITVTINHPTEQELSQYDIQLSAKEAIVFKVIDTGIGIPKDKQQVIFEAFQQADGGTSRRYGGTGLGLSISRQLTRLLGGELILESEAGKGSTFKLFLPLNPPFNTENENQIKTAFPVVETNVLANQAKSLSIQTEPAIDIPQTVATNKAIIDDRDNLQADDKFILIVEDDRKFSTILSELARKKQFKSIIAEDGKIALELASKYKPHAIILDIGLPQIDGLTVMERLKDNFDTRHIPVHFISGGTEQDVEVKKMGAIGYLHKPVNMDDLAGTFGKIKQFLEKTVRKVLLISDNEQHQIQIKKLIAGESVQITIVKNLEIALTSLNKISPDCIILDLEKKIKPEVCEKIRNTSNLSQIPTIVYSNENLVLREAELFECFPPDMLFKAVESPERLLEETTLFLHQVEAKLPEEKRKILKMLHDKEAILKAKTVLIVDDDIRNSFALTTFLESKGMEAIIAENGKEALELLDKHSEVAIILMDIMMPEMDGYEAIQTLRKQQRFCKLPIIALTAKAMKDDKAKCIKAGANDYLTKPVDTNKLLTLMRVWLYR